VLGRPNTRVQRTRVARCARPGSPLTRHPLGRQKSRCGLAAFAFVAVLASRCSSSASAQDTCSGTKTYQQGYSSDLIAASGSGDLALVEKLIADGADVNFQECDDLSGADGRMRKVLGWSAVMIASAHGFDEVVKALVVAGANLDLRTSSGETAMSMASAADREGTVQLLRQLGARE